MYVYGSFSKKCPDSTAVIRGNEERLSDTLQESLVLLIEKTMLFSNEFINILCNAKIEVQISKLCV